MSALLDAGPGTTDVPAPHCDLAVVGAGILGLAVAREWLLRHPDRTVLVLDKEDTVAAHQTSHNSGVIHAGIYYQPGSLKARLCVDGARALYDFCEQHAVAYERCGKVIVATDASQLDALDELERRGRANDVPGLKRLSGAELRAIEPHVRGVAALHSPHTGIVDFAAVAAALRREVQRLGGAVALNCAVDGVRRRGRSLRIEHSRGSIEASHAIFCAGAWADRLAVMCGATAAPRIVPFRGAYLRLREDRRHLVRSLIYPVPDPRLPFLGVHLTRHMGGDVLIGPTALIAGARDAYDLRRVRLNDVVSTLTWPGTPRLMRRFWRTGLTEMRHAVSRRAFVAAAAQYVPELEPRDVEPAWAGVRGQALASDGRLVDDFAFSMTERALHVRNAPSPAATSSLAIARHVVARAEEAFEVVR